MTDPDHQHESETNRESDPASDRALGRASNSPDGIADATMPAELASDLSALFGNTVDTSSLDQSILASAKSHFAEHAAAASEPPNASDAPDGSPVRTPAPLRAWWARWRIAEVAGLAAAIGLIVWISSPGSNEQFSDRSPGELPDRSRVAMVGDVDRNGKVDILDAYLLQRSINAGETLQTDWDMTGDGQINRDDVSAVAMLAVKLDGGQRL